MLGNVPAARRAGFLRQRHETQAVDYPPRHRHDPVVGEVIQVVVERLDRVERVLGQRVRAGGRGCPRVDEGRLNDVVAIRGASDEASAVVHGDADARMRVDPAGELAELVAHDVVRDDRVDLDAVHMAGAEHQRGDEIATAAGPDDERGKPGRLQPIRDGGQLVFQILDVREIGRHLEDRRRCRGVDVHVAGVRHRACERRAQRPVVVRAFVDADARERIPFGEEHLVAHVALGLADVEHRDARQLAGERDGHDRSPDGGEPETAGS